METPITGQMIIKALFDAGVIADDKVRRVIIDAPFDDVCTIFVQQLADTRAILPHTRAILPQLVIAKSLRDWEIEEL